METNETPNYSYTTTGSALGMSTITVVTSDGTVMQMAENSPNYERLTQALFERSPENVIVGLMLPVLEAGTNLQQVSDRIGFDGSNITFDGDIVDTGLSRQIKSLLNEGGTNAQYRSLVAFMEKLYQNPSKKSIESLYGFLSRYDITILPNGDFLGYKGVRSDLTSVHSGFGIVNGEVFENSHLLNNIGSVIEMPRAQVNGDTEIGCSTGLHVGSYEYAKKFTQGKLLTVQVNPRDVVSVPDDCNFQKIRTSRYTVVAETDVKLPSVFVAEDWDYDDCDFCDYDSGELCDNCEEERVLNEEEAEEVEEQSPTVLQVLDLVSRTSPNHTWTFTYTKVNRAGEVTERLVENFKPDFNASRSEGDDYRFVRQGKRKGFRLSQMSDIEIVLTTNNSDETVGFDIF